MILKLFMNVGFFFPFFFQNIIQIERTLNFKISKKFTLFSSVFMKCLIEHYGVGH